MEWQGACPCYYSHGWRVYRAEFAARYSCFFVIPKFISQIEEYLSEVNFLNRFQSSEYFSCLLFVSGSWTFERSFICKCRPYVDQLLPMKKSTNYWWNNRNAVLNSWRLSWDHVQCWLWFEYGASRKFWYPLFAQASASYVIRMYKSHDVATKANIGKTKLIKVLS